MENLWAMGSFWMLITFGITSMLIMIVKGNFHWYQYLFILLLLPGLLIIVGCMVLTPPGSLSGHDLIELIKHTTKLIYDSITAVT